MARNTPKSSKSAAPRTSAKRGKPQEPESPVVSKRPRRQASAASFKSTPTKSQYFEGSSTSDEETPEASFEDGESNFEDDVDEVEASSDQEDDEDDASTDDDGDKTTPQRNTKDKGSSARKQVWKEGVKTGLGPGTQVIIKKPKARAAGSTPYEDHTIHPNTMLFLKDLKANNNRPWLKCMTPPSVFRQLRCLLWAGIESGKIAKQKLQHTIPTIDSQNRTGGHMSKRLPRRLQKLTRRYLSYHTKMWWVKFASSLASVDLIGH